MGVSAGYAPLTLGTKSIGSIVMPAASAALFALKPTLDSVSMDGVFRTSTELDVLGGMARSTADVAMLTQTALTDASRKLLPDGSYQKFLTKDFRSLKIGFVNPVKWSLHATFVQLPESTAKQIV